MIILSGVLVVLAIALLVTGIVTGNTGHEVAGLDGLKLIYVSIGVSIISALCLAIGVFLRRKELFGSTEYPPSSRRSAASRSGKATRPAKAKARVGAGDDTASTPMPSATATDVPAETSVYVVPGRKRYHLETCRQLAGRDKEELTFVEAREEGFTACTACLPDTALAARAASTDTATLESPVTEPPATTEDRTETADLTRREDDDPAQVTRTDLPVTRLEDDELAPAAESPAAAEPSSPPAETSTYDSDADAPADTTRFDEPAETPEVAPEPPVERPLARSRSFFEPLDHEEPSAATEPEPQSEPEAEPEPHEPEDAEPAAREPEDLDTEPEAPVDTTETEAEPEAEAEAAEAAAEGTEPEPAAEAPAAEAPATDTEAAADEEPDDEPSADEATDREESDHEAAEPLEAAAEDTPDEDASKDAAPAEDTSGAPSLPYVRILSGTKRYHRPDCALIEDIADDADDLETLSPAEAKERGCTPCLVCQPDKDSSDEGY